VGGGAGGGVEGRVGREGAHGELDADADHQDGDRLEGGQTEVEDQVKLTGGVGEGCGCG
jgi:hypothetical protein